MLRTLALSTLALLAIDGVSTVFAPVTGVSLTAEAAAQSVKFTGKIKRIRIKKRRVGETFPIKVDTSTINGDTEIAGGTATLTDPDTGAVVETVELGTAFHGTVVGSVATSASELGGTIEVGLEVEEAGVVRNPRIRFDITERGGDGASQDGWKARATLNPQGTLRVVVMNEDRTWDGSTLTGLSVTTESGAELPLDIEGAGTSLQAEFETDLDTYDSLTATVTLVDVDGNELESLDQDFTFAGTGTVEDAPLDEISLTKADGEFQLTTWTVDDGSELSLEVDLMDAETGESVLMTTDDTPVLTQRGFAVGPLEFEDAPDGSLYLVVVDLLNAEGKVVGSQQEAELTVPKFDGEAIGQDFAAFDDKTGVVGLLQGSDGIWAYVATESDEAVASAVLTFEEPFEGPTPIETEVTLAEVTSFHKWVQTGDVDLPGSWELTLSVVTSDGEPVEMTTVTGTGDGSVYAKDDGKEDDKSVFNVVSVGDKEVMLNIGF